MEREEHQVWGELGDDYTDSRPSCNGKLEKKHSGGCARWAGKLVKHTTASPTRESGAEQVRVEAARLHIPGYQKQIGLSTPTKLLSL